MERLATRRRFGQTANLLFGTSQTENRWRRGSQCWKLHIRTRLSQSTGTGTHKEVPSKFRRPTVEMARIRFKKTSLAIYAYC